MQIGTLVTQIKNAFGLLMRAIDGLSNFALSLVATLIIPTVPLVIEWFKFSKVKSDSFLLTAAVLSAGFLFSAEHNLYRTGYGMIFLVGLIIACLGNPNEAASQVGGYASNLLLAVAVLHATERLWWHVVQNRSFPDYIRRS